MCATKGQRIWFGVGEGVWSNGTIFETRVVAGRPAALVYTGDGIKLRVHDPETDVEYEISGTGIRSALINLDIEEAIKTTIAIAEGIVRGDTRRGAH